MKCLIWLERWEYYAWKIVLWFGWLTFGQEILCIRKAYCRWTSNDEEVKSCGDYWLVVFRWTLWDSSIKCMEVKTWIWALSLRDWEVVAEDYRIIRKKCPEGEKTANQNFLIDCLFGCEVNGQFLYYFFLINCVAFAFFE